MSKSEMGHGLHGETRIYLVPTLLHLVPTLLRGNANSTLNVTKLNMKRMNNLPQVANREVQNDKLTIFACPKTHDRVVALFEHFPKGRVLDMGAGEGALSLRLQAEGFEVRALDLLPERFKAAGIPCDRGDLNRAMPYQADAFDYLCGVELIEHLENPFGFVRECRRILRPGGKLVLTTPNILNLASRIKYLLTGFYPLTTRPLNECARSPVWDHIHPITYYQLRYVLHTNGFRIEHVETDRYRKSAAYWLWLYPLLRLVTRTTMRKEQDPGQRARNREIRRTMRSPALLLGRTVIVVAEKV